MTSPRKTLPLTIERLKEVMSFDGTLGRFIWLKNYQSRFIGQVAGNDHPNGYRTVMIDGIRYMEHRLVWFYFHGKWPINIIDHIDLNKSNNKIENLRDVSHSFNCQNQNKGHAGTLTGVLGTSICNGKFIAQIVVDGRKIHLGRFDSVEKASDVYIEAKRRLHAGSTV